MSGPGNESEDQFHASYHEEDGLLILANPLLRIAFSAADGTVLSLVERESGVDLIAAEEAASQGTLWRLELDDGNGEPASVTNRDCAQFTHTLGRHRHEGCLHLWLQWRGFQVGSQVIEAALTAQVVMPEDSRYLLFSEEVELPEGRAVRSLTLPCIGPIGHPDPLLEEGLFLPLSGGIFLPNPRSRSSPGQPSAWEVDYPGPASLQLLGCAFGDRAAVWLSARDMSGARKSMGASGLPSSGRLQLWLRHYPVLRPEGHWSAGYPGAVGVVSGDWFEAAREYRAWASGQPWAARGRGGERVLPPLTSAYGLWASHWGGARRCAPAVRELQRIVNVPIKLDWRCWHACARDGVYPDYLPPRDGDEAQERAEQQLGDAGVLDQFSVNALLASGESQAWKEHDLAPHAIQPQDDGPIVPSPAPLAAMCPGDDHWRGLVAAVAGELASRGADGILLEGLGLARATSCRAPNHGHPPANPAEWTSNVRALLADVRAAIGENRQLATDEVLEPYLAHVDAFLSPHAAAERQGLGISAWALAPFASPQSPAPRPYHWQPIPLFAAVYHDYTTVIGAGVSLVNQRPHDPAWAASVIAELRQPAQVMQRDYQTQFCLEVARAMIWGYQPQLEGFSPEQARDEGNRHKLAFLAAALRAQAWGIGALLPQSQFLGPVAVECPAVEADMLVNPPYATAAERLWYRQPLPSVMASAWRVPGGGLALVLVNIHQQTVEFTARLRASRLGLQLPLRLIGRTFSEDGDVPAASLRASGAEIGGKLPGRAIVLVSLR
jgi:hypothetical protein